MKDFFEKLPGSKLPETSQHITKPTEAPKPNIYTQDPFFDPVEHQRRRSRPTLQQEQQQREILDQELNNH